MNRIRNIALLTSVVSCFSHPMVLASEKIRIDDETVAILKDNYRVFIEKNAKKMAQREIAETYQTHSHDRALLLNLQSVAMPICDTQRPPFEWKYVAPSSDEHVLKYIGNRELSAQFLRWTDSIWIRNSGTKKKFREGMYCGSPYSENPSLNNYATIEIDTSFVAKSQNPNTNAVLTDQVLLQLGTKYTDDTPHLMNGEIQLGVSASLKGSRIAIELWAFGDNSAKMLASQWHDLIPSSTTSQILKIQAHSEPRRQTHLILRLEPLANDRATTDQIVGKIYLINARIFPS